MSIQATCRHCGNTGVAWDTGKPCRCAMGRAAAQVLGEKKASETMATDDELSNTYTWEVSAKSNHGEGLKLVMPVGGPATLFRVLGPNNYRPLAEFSEETLDSLSLMFSWWREWYKQRTGQTSERSGDDGEQV